MARISSWRSEAGRSAYREAYQAAWAGLPKLHRIEDVATPQGVVRIARFPTTNGANAGATKAVLLPGRSAAVPVWAKAFEPLLADREVVAMDVLGDTGMSEQKRPFADADDQAAWVTEVIRHIGGPVHLIGHSFGGWIAASVAAQRPDAVRSLTLLDPVLVLAPLKVSVLLTAAIAILPGMPARWRRRMLARIGGTGPIDPNDPVARLIETGSAHFSAALPQPTRFPPERLAALRMPVHVSIGGASSIHDAEIAARRAELIPNREVVVWPGASHSLPMEVPAVFGESVRAFLRRSDGA